MFSAANPGRGEKKDACPYKRPVGSGGGEKERLGANLKKSKIEKHSVVGGSRVNGAEEKGRKRTKKTLRPENCTPLCKTEGEGFSAMKH